MVAICPVFVPSAAVGAVGIPVKFGLSGPTPPIAVSIAAVVSFDSIASAGAEIGASAPEPSAATIGSVPATGASPA
ncbi:hypothetical protein, partial [Bradyrhizobium sp. SZCCHNR3008]|uniref:hypothetical protein n=1 Tax=Bradyrhizobium sp. SZCCHNR3008 TaxID=3057390 RepID=UPI002915E03E